MKFLLVFAGIIIVRILINAYRLYRLHVIKRIYEGWFDKKNDKFQEYVLELISLFKAANVSDASIAIVQPAGYNHVMTGQTSAFQNAGNRRMDIVAHILNSFDRAAGVFKRNMAESLNPIFWIGFVVFLPKHLLTYLNVKESSISIRISQMIWWLVAPVAAIFRTQIYEAITKLFQ